MKIQNRLKLLSHCDALTNHNKEIFMKNILQKLAMSLVLGLCAQQAFAGPINQTDQDKKLSDGSECAVQSRVYSIVSQSEFYVSEYDFDCLGKLIAKLRREALHASGVVRSEKFQALQVVSEKMTETLEAPMFGGYYHVNPSQDEVLSAGKECAIKMRVREVETNYVHSIDTHDTDCLLALIEKIRAEIMQNDLPLAKIDRGIQIRNVLLTKAQKRMRFNRDLTYGKYIVLNPSKN